MADHSPIRGLPGRTFSRVAEPLMASLNRMPELVERTRRAGSDLAYVATRRMAFASDVPASYVEFVSEMLAQTPLEVVADFYPAFDELDEYQALPGLGWLPVVVIGGEDDLFTPVAHTDRITELLPDAVALRLKDCGHLGMIEHPEAVNERAGGPAGPGPRRPLTAPVSSGTRRTPVASPKAVAATSAGHSAAQRTPRQQHWPAQSSSTAAWEEIPLSCQGRAFAGAPRVRPGPPAKEVSRRTMPAKSRKADGTPKSRWSAADRAARGHAPRRRGGQPRKGHAAVGPETSRLPTERPTAVRPAGKAARPAG